MAASAVVGIGCAGGGLDAIESILRTFPSGLRTAIVIASHVNTDDSDVLVDLISPLTSFTVKSLNESPTQLNVDTVYVVPQRSIVVETEFGYSAMQTDDVDQRAKTVDRLFTLLAENYGERSIGVVVSGTGSDGTLGLAAIRAVGGMTIVQSPETAHHDEMPRSAAASADHALELEQISDELSSHIQHLIKRKGQAEFQVQSDQIEAILPRICDALLAATEYEFRHYKKQTLIRRILRRMQVLRIDDPDEYLSRLQNEREEAHSLFRELLISVTAFFRDPDTFATLSQHVIPKLFDRYGTGETIRVWVPGCATGQEAYTLAMLMIEERDKHGSDIEIQIFATDIDQRALNFAREGTYASSIKDELTPRRLDRFFRKTGNKYVVRKELRDMCVFSKHNLVSDPPFSQMDLISCRNLLIYLGQPLQLKLIPLFHFALRPQGYLLLGPSENLTSHTEIFRPIDKKHRISQRKAGPAKPTTLFSGTRGGATSLSHARVASPNEVDIHQISQRILLDEFAPRYAVVNEDGHLVCTSPGLERYFAFPDGPYANNVVKIAKSGLRSGLRAAFRESKESLRTVVRDDLTLKSGDGLQYIRLTVQPMPEIGEDVGLFMLIFHELGLSSTRHGNTETLPDSEKAIEQLERELDQTRSDLENTVQELEGSNEELKSSNEELRSIVEELQSANEELETSKEEIQAGMEALSRARSDLQNLLDGTQIATIFLDSNGKINSFTPTVTNIYNVKEGDIGRPLSDITFNSKEMPKIPTAEEIRKQDLEILECEVQTEDGRWYLRRVLPYYHESEPDGVILTFIDISQKKREEMQLTTALSVTQVFSDSSSFSEAVPKLLNGLRDSLDAEVCTLWIVDTKTQELFCAEVDFDRSSTKLKDFISRSEELRFQRNQGLPGHVWDSLQPLWIQDATAEFQQSVQDYRRHDTAIEAGLISGIAWPILTGDQFRGVIEFFTSRPLDREQSVLVSLLREVGREIGQFMRRKTLDDKFQDEQSRKAAILDAALDCIVTMDMEGNIEDFNSAAEQTFGYHSDEVRGQQLADLLIPAEYRQLHREGMVKYLQTGEATVIGQRIELTALRADQTQFPIELAINVSHNLDGSPFFTGYIRDVSDRKEKEREDADRERRLAMALKAGGMAVWEWTDQASLWSEELYELLGLSHETTASPETLFNCVHPDDLQGLQDAWQKATCGIEPYHHEFRIVLPNGEIRWLAGVGEFVRKDDEVSQIFGLNWDITQERNAELAVRESESFLRRTLDSLAAFVGVCEPDGTLIQINKPAMELSPSTESEVLGLQLWNTHAFSYNKEIQEQVREAVERAAGGVSSRLDAEIRVHDDDRMFVDLQIVPMRNDADQVTHLIPSAIDISERRESQEKLAHLAAVAEAASRAKSEFVANMSHEIRTPMTAVLGYTDLLLAQEEDEEKLNHLKTIQRNGNFLLEIINDILDLSKIEAGKLDIAVERFSVPELVADVLSMMSVRATEKNLAFSVKYEGTLPQRIESDSKRLRQILINLIGNAVKFTNSGSVILTVREVSCDEQAKIQFNVADTGIGMSLEQQSRLFQPFSQGDASVSRSFGGTGLGLVISRRLATLLGGDISVESEPDQGSAFTCTISAGDVSNEPRIHPINETGSLEEQTPQNGAIQNNQQLSCRVLIVDDRRDVRFLSSRILIRAGATIEECEDGMEAIERFESDSDLLAKIDLVLLDMQMPRLDGYQTATRLRSLGFTKPIVALTADAMQSDMSRCIEAGCNEFLSKPIDSAQLIEAVSRLTSATESPILNRTDSN